MDETRQENGSDPRSAEEQVVLRMLRIPEKMDEVQCTLDEFRCKFETLETVIDRTNQSVQELRASLGTVRQTHECLVLMSEHQRQLTQEHYLEHVILPLVRRALPVCDWVADALRRAPELSALSGSDAMAILHGAMTQITEWLLVYGVETFEEPVGSVFDARIMKAGMLDDCSPVSASDELRVETLIRPGFRRGKYIIRSQVVRVATTPSQTDGTEGRSGC